MTALDRSAQSVLNAMASAGYPPLDQMEPVVARQAAAMGFKALQGPKAEVSAVRDLAAEGPAGKIPLRIYRPRAADAAAALPALVFFHGGGWVIGSIEMYDTLCRLLCNAGDCAVISVDYRLAPEHKFPAAVDDAFAALKWIADNAVGLGIDAVRLAVGGDSAGGNLAAVSSLLARDAGGPALRMQLLIYPATDLRGGTASYQANAEGYFLTGTLMQWFGNHYLNGPADVEDWRASPLLAQSHAQLPPAHVLVAGFDPLRDDGVAYAQRLEAAGVPVELHEAGGQIHGYLSMDGAIPEMHAAVADIGRSLRRALA
jgi:acetyl esterase